MYQYFFHVNKYRSKEAKRKTAHPGVSKVNAGSVLERENDFLNV